MKFGKSLSNQIEETLPEWRDKFLSYKELKKLLKLIDPKGGDRSKRPRLDNDEAATSSDAMTKEESDFISLLEAELEKFNSFFVEKEEEYIIRQKMNLNFGLKLCFPAPPLDFELALYRPSWVASTIFLPPSELAYWTNPAV